MQADEASPEEFPKSQCLSPSVIVGVADDETGKDEEEVNEVISLSETAGFIYMHAERAENVYELTQLVAEEYEIEPAEILEDVRNVVLTLQKKGILL